MGDLLALSCARVRRVLPGRGISVLSISGGGLFMSSFGGMLLRWCCTACVCIVFRVCFKCFSMCACGKHVCIGKVCLVELKIVCFMCLGGCGRCMR